MKYSNPKNIGRSIIHEFSKEGEHYIGGKRWSNVDMGFREVPTNSDNRSFMFTIRYSNPKDREFRVNQFTMKEDEIKEFLDIVYETVYNPPKFKEKYTIGEKFIIPSIAVMINKQNYGKETIYTNVEAAIINSCNLNKTTQYMLSFDGNTIVVNEEYLNKLKSK
jgi:hypothetical protein